LTIGAVIVGAGRGERLGDSTPKCLVKVAGVPLLALAAAPFQECSAISRIALVVPGGFEEEVRQHTRDYGLMKVAVVIPGGERRQDSVEGGINAIGPDCDGVLIHDGARSLVSTTLIDAVCTALADYEAVLPGLAVTDAMHIKNGDHADRGLDRRSLVAAQTPQGFRRDLLFESLARGRERDLTADDEVSLVRETHGVRARIIAGERGNVKLTWPEDLMNYRATLIERALAMGGHL